MGMDVHELVLHHVLHFFHADSAVQRLALVGHVRRDLSDLILGQAALSANRIAGLCHSRDDLGNIKGNFCAVSFDDLHRFSSFK